MLGAIAQFARSTKTVADKVEKVVEAISFRDTLALFQGGNGK